MEVFGREFQKPHTGRAWWQVFNTLGSLLVLWVALYFVQRGETKDLASSTGWWITVAFRLRGANSRSDLHYFSRLRAWLLSQVKKVNNALGFITGLLTFTPYHHWKWEHSVHHASTGDLSRRGMGDIWTLTVKEYLDSTRWKRFTYRLSRNPIILFFVAPLYCF